MISNLRGEVLELNNSSITLDVNGVGYEVICSAALLAGIEPGQQLRLTIYTDVREDSIRLFGFEDRLEKQVFLLLKGVKGVGSKSASDIISCVEKRDLLRAIAEADISKLQSVRGIGKKTAERIVVELRDRVQDFVESFPSQSLKQQITRVDSAQDAVEALKALGFLAREAEAAVAAVGASTEVVGMDSGEIVKQALKYI